MFNKTIKQLLGATNSDQMPTKEHPNLVRFEAVALVASLHSPKANRERPKPREFTEADARRTRRSKAQKRTS